MKKLINTILKKLGYSKTIGTVPVSETLTIERLSEIIYMEVRAAMAALPSRWEPDPMSVIPEPFVGKKTTWSDGVLTTHFPVKEPEVYKEASGELDVRTMMKINFRNAYKSLASVEVLLKGKHTKYPEAENFGWGQFVNAVEGQLPKHLAAIEIELIGGGYLKGILWRIRLKKPNGLSGCFVPFERIAGAKDVPWSLVKKWRYVKI